MRKVLLALLLVAAALLPSGQAGACSYGTWSCCKDNPAEDYYEERGYDGLAFVFGGVELRSNSVAFCYRVMGAGVPVVSGFVALRVQSSATGLLVHQDCGFDGALADPCMFGTVGQTGADLSGFQANPAAGAQVGARPRGGAVWVNGQRVELENTDLLLAPGDAPSPGATYWFCALWWGGTCLVPVYSITLTVGGDTNNPTVYFSSPFTGPVSWDPGRQCFSVGGNPC